MLCDGLSQILLYSFVTQPDETTGRVHQVREDNFVREEIGDDHSCCVSAPTGQRNPPGKLMPCDDLVVSISPTCDDDDWHILLNEGIRYVLAESVCWSNVDPCH